MAKITVCDTCGITTEDPILIIHRLIEPRKELCSIECLRSYINTYEMALNEAIERDSQPLVIE